MRFFLDTEFYEDGERIHLISIALVHEDGFELYLENTDFDWSIVPEDHFIQEHVRPHLLQGKSSEEVAKWNNPYGGPAMGFFGRGEFAQQLLEFVTQYRAQRSGESPQAEFYGWYADYDWVALCQLFGTMMQLPKGFPMYCRDLKQTVDGLQVDKEWIGKNVPKNDQEHSAIADARWNRELFKALVDYSGYDDAKESYASGGSFSIELTEEGTRYFIRAMDGKEFPVQRNFLSTL